MSLLAAAVSPAIGAPPGFAEGVRAYGARQYAQAAAYFRQAATKAPTDPLVHYYLGLSYQGTNQMSLAKAEYSYVANYAPNPLRSQASLALNNLSRYSTTYSGSGSASAAPRVASAAAPPSAGAKVSGKLQLYLFTADW